MKLYINPKKLIFTAKKIDFQKGMSTMATIIFKEIKMFRLSIEEPNCPFTQIEINEKYIILSLGKNIQTETFLSMYNISESAGIALYHHSNDNQLWITFHNNIEQKTLSTFMTLLPTEFSADLKQKIEIAFLDHNTLPLRLKNEPFDIQDQHRKYNLAFQIISTVATTGLGYLCGLGEMSLALSAVASLGAAHWLCVSRERWKTQGYSTLIKKHNEKTPLNEDEIYSLIVGECAGKSFIHQATGLAITNTWTKFPHNPEYYGALSAIERGDNEVVAHLRVRNPLNKR